MPRASGMQSVLFVCTGNQFRSPAAAACFQRLLTNAGCTDWLVESAGTWVLTDQVPPEAARRAAAKLGLNIGDHRARAIDGVMLQEFDLIVVMERGQKEAIGLEFPLAAPRVHLLTEVSGNPPGDVRDPMSPPFEIDKVMQEVCSLVQQGFERIKNLATDMPEHST